MFSGVKAQFIFKFYCELCHSFTNFYLNLSCGSGPTTTGLSSFWMLSNLHRGKESIQIDYVGPERGRHAKKSAPILWTVSASDHWAAWRSHWCFISSLTNRCLRQIPPRSFSQAPGRLLSYLAYTAVLAGPGCIWEGQRWTRLRSMHAL